ncbi:hypothetical protein F5Y12DRAFT_469548 [Xylaria sp. FL1777]|nr:hypothetical protein F5Y12DRAFT_469548 [Xylaria sp. FL1777]
MSSWDHDDQSAPRLLPGLFLVSSWSLAGLLLAASSKDTMQTKHSTRTGLESADPHMPFRSRLSTVATAAQNKSILEVAHASLLAMDSEVLASHEPLSLVLFRAREGLNTEEGKKTASSSPTSHYSEFGKGQVVQITPPDHQLHENYVIESSSRDSCRVQRREQRERRGKACSTQRCGSVAHRHIALRSTLASWALWHVLHAVSQSWEAGNTLRAR